MDRDLGDISQRVCENHDPVDSGVSETVIEIRETHIAYSNANSTGLTRNEAVLEGEAPKVEEGEDKSSSCMVDVSNDDFLVDNQRVCRICHLSSKESGKSLTELIELGCGCKGELGIAHLDCAEAWFRVRGNRLCEICGQTAENITSVRDNRFMDDWNGVGPDGSSNITVGGSSDGTRRCLGGQPLCNFLMACLVVAFVLPWFFRVNMF